MIADRNIKNLRNGMKNSEARKQFTEPSSRSPLDLLVSSAVLSSEKTNKIEYN